MVVGNYFIKIFSVQQYVRYQIIESDSPQNSSFPFSSRMVASQNPPRHCLRLSRPLTTTQMPYKSASKIVPLIICYDPLLWSSIGIILVEKTTHNINSNVNYYHHQIVLTCKLRQGKVTPRCSLCQEKYKIS